uniref:C-type lectin domain-containing protein n=1 Tax=Esox lucius TaxID=8010 RepID=A0A3P9A3R5_ESOLU
SPSLNKYNQNKTLSTVAASPKCIVDMHGLSMLNQQSTLLDTTYYAEPYFSYPALGLVSASQTLPQPPDPRCRLCPENWLWKSGHCYFFSVGLEEDQTWGHSAEFCRQNNASLAFIGDHDEMVHTQETGLLDRAEE